MHLHFIILVKIGKNFAKEEEAYLSVYLKVWYTCARKIGLATAEAGHNVSKRIFRCWKTTVPDLDDRRLQSNLNSKNNSDEYSRTPPARSMIMPWRPYYQQRGTNTHRRGNGPPQMKVQTKNRIRQIFDDDSWMSLRAAASETSVAHFTIWNFLRKELGRFLYKLKMATLLTEDHKMRNKSYAQYCRSELWNDAGYLIKIVFSVWINKQAKLQNLERWIPERGVWDASKLPIIYGMGRLV